MTSKIQFIKELCSLLSDTIDLPILFISNTGEIPFALTKNKVINPLYTNSSKEDLFTILNIRPTENYNFPLISRTRFNENYINISVYQNEAFVGTLLIGPSLHHRLSENEIIGVVNDTQAFKYKEELIDFYQSVPVLNRRKLLSISAMIFYIVHQELITPEKILQENKKMEQLNIKTINTNIEISKTLQELTFHHDPLLEIMLIKNIQEGRVEELRNQKMTVAEENIGVLSKSSYIRSKKNLSICGIAIATRAAMNGGLHPEKAYTLSDVFIQQLEELKDINDIDRFTEEVFYTFAEAVSKVREKRYSKTITICQSYILKHVYDEINHTDLANEVDLNPNYLSVLFKQEVGISVTEYIQQVRIDEAKNLLSYTDTPISVIGSWLNFTDQSYFTKIFKKHVGITPKKYRERHFPL